MKEGWIEPFLQDSQVALLVFAGGAGLLSQLVVQVILCPIGVVLAGVYCAGASPASYMVAPVVSLILSSLVDRL